jgi:acetyl-CoA C-acetyltransferase
VPDASEPRTGLSMGESCELMAKRWQITREQQDALALDSHTRANEAWDSGFFDDLVIPYGSLRRDDNIRGASDLQKLVSLKPCFDRSSLGTLTAGNSTPLTDGASSVLLASESWARKRGLPILAWLRFGKAWAVDFAAKETDAREGLLMAPAYAVPAMLADAGLTLQDFDYYEIHEAFAAQVLCTLKAWESKEFCQQRLALPDALGAIDRERLNVRGSSIAIGHPFAATGSRIIATLAKLLATDTSARRGLISVCTAGGMGVTAILERG